MASGTTVPPLSGTVTVAVGLEQAFEVFTGHVGSLDRLVGGETVRATIDGGGGWVLLVESYARTAGDRR